MSNLFSKVYVLGLVASIDYDKRDVTVLTKTPMGRDVKVVVHMWKNERTSTDEAHVGRAIWEDILDVGSEIYITGHMGNNGRVIATSFANPNPDEADNEVNETDYS